MANIVNLRAKGLYTYANFLSSIPEGSLIDATNVVIDRDGIIEPRRGIKQYGTFGSDIDRAKQLLDYKQQVLVHYGSKLAYDDGTGTFTDFSGTFESVDPLMRIKGVELNSNYYITTNSGIKKICATSDDLSLAEISDAGGIKALDGTATVDYSNPGFLTGLSKVAYKIVWGTKDANSNLILGTPSSRIVVTNYNTNSGTVFLTFAVPDNITTDYFYQIYRTSVFTAINLTLLDETDPGLEMKLVIENAITSGEVAARQVTNLNDITPESFQSGGTLLYTNPVSGEGILQANERPPVAKDIAVFKNSVFYANTRTRHILPISLLGTGGFHYGDITNITLAANPTTITSTAHGLTTGDRIAIVGTGDSAVDTTHIITVVDPNMFTIPITATIASPTGGSFYSSYVTISNGTTTNRYFFVGRPEITQFTFDTKANITDTSWFEISSANNLVRYAVWFDKTGTSTAPTTTGLIQVRVDISSVTAAEDVAIAVQNAIETVSNDFLIVHPSPTSHILTFTNANSGPSDNAAAGTTAPGGAFAISITQQGFGEDAAKKYIRWSTYLSTAQAVDDTARSFVNVINKNTSEIIYGYYLSGPDDVPGIMDFEARQLSSTAFTIIANNSSVGALFNPDITTAATSTNETSLNRIYFSKQQQPEAVPIVNYLDVGPKDKEIYRIIALRDSLFVLKEDGVYRITGENSLNFSLSLFDGSCHLTAPDTAAIMNNQIYCLTDDGISTITETGIGIISRPIENYFRQFSNETFPNFFSASFGEAYHTDHSYYIWVPTLPSDTYATQCFRYNSFTESWTRWNTSQTCIKLLPFKDKLYFGSAVDNMVEVERKTNSRFDYADYEFELSIPNNNATDTSITVSSVANSAIGNAVIQTQYVTISQFNLLLLKLDIDPRVGVSSFDTDYASTLTMNRCESLTNKLIALVAKLNADPGTSGGYVFSGTTDFATIQTEYNAIITALNLDPKLKFTNYLTSVGIKNFEITITEITRNSQQLHADSIPPFMIGPLIEYEGIPTSVIWAPTSMGDPSLLKHVRESTMIFESSDFRGGKVSYNTDLSPSFEEISFIMDGNGSWGNFIWGGVTFGGAGTSTPFRTYIPRQKQRCRYIKAKFKHSDAFYKFSILGMSYVFEISSDRAYRGRNG